jgi:aspartate-semialdehyde dehydrogenase
LLGRSDAKIIKNKMRIKMSEYNVAVVGATGLVGRKMLQVLEERKFPVKNLILLASEKSVGVELKFNGEVFKVEKLNPEKFKGIDIALFSAGSEVSREFAPEAVKRNCVVIDNSSEFRLNKEVPLVVPEVNREKIFEHKGIIANPNCSTIQLVVVLKPLHDNFKIKRVVVSTYQSVTGAGKRGVDQLLAELKSVEVLNPKFPHRIAFNCIPHIDVFYEDGYTKEEHKIMRETKKIMDDETIKITATCVRVPVIGGHSESVNVEFERDFEIEDVKKILSNSPGIILQDEPFKNFYPMPINSNERDEVFVGRIRRDYSVENGLNLWIVADNLRKGAATNAVQIAQELIKSL